MVTTIDSSTLPRLLTAKDVSTQTGIPQESVYRFAKAGLIPHVRIGRAVRFSPKAIEAWIESGGAA